MNEPLFEPVWVGRHLGEIGLALVQHLQLTVIAVVIGLAISLPLGIYAHRHRRAYPPITWVAGALYTIPSLALFAFLAPYTGLTTLTAEIGLVGYTLLILIRNIVAGLRSVPADSIEAAKGMGYNNGQLLWRVELPLALPVIFAGIRIASVTTIGLVTITALVGKGGLGQFILEGLDRFFSTPIIVGAGLSVMLALVAEAAFRAAETRLTPWASLKTDP
ncbi:MAG: ABC transporter permease [Actinomycetota bacterium]